MEISDECQCCISKFSVRRKPVICPKCKFNICNPCFERYTLDNLALDYIGTICMSCKEALSFDFIISNTTKSFISKKWREKRKEILASIEISKLPDTQNTANRYRELRENLQNLDKRIGNEKIELQHFLEVNSYEEVVSKIKVLNNNYMIAKNIKITLSKSSKNKEFMKHFKKIKKEYKIARDMNKDIKALVQEHLTTIHRINIFMSELNNTDEDVFNDNYENRERRTFIMPCPIGECKGFMSSSYKCGLCNKKICPKCHIEINDKDEEHVCDKDMEESVKMINTETRPCPKCGTRIYKIDGCDQMWCLHCKTAFSWDTGKIVIGERIHNPEYFRWMREHNEHIHRVENQMECNGLPDIFLLSELINNGLCSTENGELLYRLYQRIEHITQVEIPALALRINRDLRVKYLCNELSKEQMMMQLMKRERINMKNTFIACMYRLIVDVVTDKLRSCIYEKENPFVIIEHIREIISLCRYVNSQMDNFTKNHNLKTIKFKETKNELFQKIIERKKGKITNFVEELNDSE